jgi:ankyrin repeat protein
VNTKPEIIKLLIEKGVNVNAPTKYGLTALHFASNNGKLDIMLQPIKAGANLNYAAKDGKTPLDLTIHEGKADAAKLLIEKGANITPKQQVKLEELRVLPNVEFNKDQAEETAVEPVILSEKIELKADSNSFILSLEEAFKILSPQVELISDDNNDVYVL